MDNVQHGNELLKLQYTQEMRDARRATKLGGSSDIIHLQYEADEYLSRIEEEKQRIEELDGAMGEINRKIMEQKTKLGGVAASQTNNKLIERQINLLETRLDQYLVKFNESLAENRRLRVEIDGHRKQRVMYDSIYKKLERDLHVRKKQMMAIIQDSQAVYKARDKALEDLRMLKEECEKEKKEFEAEFKELGRIIQEERSMVEEMRLTQMKALAEDEEASLEVANEQEGDEGHETRRESDKWMTQDASPQRLSLEEMEGFEEALARIREETGLEDIDDVIAKFLESEEKNFSLFNYVNDLNSEIERLESSIGEVKAKIEAYKGQGMSSDTQRKKVIRELDEKLSLTETKTEEYEQGYQRSVRTINQLKTGIHSIFTRIGCASTSMEEMLGNQGVTESNMLQYLGVIEQRTSEILQMYAASQLTASSSPSPILSSSQPNGTATQGTSTFHQASVTALPLPEPKSTTVRTLSINPPSNSEMSSDEEDEEEGEGSGERPLTRQELDRRTQKAFQRAGRKGGKLFKK